jgi:hypothetical protein
LVSRVYRSNGVSGGVHQEVSAAGNRSPKVIAKYFYARYGGNQDQTAVHLHAAQPYVNGVPAILTFRVLAGYYLAAGEAERAISAAERALREVAAFPQPWFMEDERDWTTQILVEARAALSLDSAQFEGDATLEPGKE